MKPGMLLVSAIAPWPQTSGGAVRMSATLKYLSEKYDLYYLTFGDMPDEKAKTEIYDRYCRLWQVYPLGKRTVFSSIPYFFSCWRSGKLERMMGKILDEHQIDIVRIEFTQIAYLKKYFPKNIKTTFVAHDISTVSFKRRIASAAGENTGLVGIIKTGTTYANSIEIAGFEKFWLPLYDEVVVMSETDAQILRKDFKLTNVRIEPNGIEEINFLPAKNNEKIMNIGYIGAPDHPPNKTAIDFTINKVLPILRERKVDFRYYLAGHEHARAETEEIKILGEVKSPREFYEKIDVLVAPLFAGSGTRVKILESLSYGIPVVTTKVGAEGLEIKSPYLQIIDDTDPEKLANKIVNALQEIKKQPEKWISTKARNHLTKQLKKYLWRRIFI